MRMLVRPLLLAIAATLMPFLMAVSTAPAAQAQCAPEGARTIWKITHIRKSYAPTGVESNWVAPKHGDWTINYSETTTAEVNATVGASATAEAGAIFAKASVTISAEVGTSFSKAKTWSYSVTVPKTRKWQYKMRQRQETRTFLATKYGWVGGRVCEYRRLKSTNAMMPITSTKSLVWDTTRRVA